MKTAAGRRGGLAILVWIIGSVFALGRPVTCQAQDSSAEQAAGPASAAVESRDWAVKAALPGSIARLKENTLRAFVEEQIKVKEGGGSVCSATVVDLSGRRSYSILASIDWSGRGFCNEVRVFDKGPDGIVNQQFEAWNASDVRKLIVDLGAPGEKQLAIPRGYSQYSGARCQATWTVIYRERDGKMADDSASFGAFYQDRLRTLQDRLDHGEAEPECIQMEVDKIKRFLGISPTAGFGLAQEWIQSGDASLRTKAIVVFGDIGDEPSRQELRKLSSGNSPDAVLAKHFLDITPGSTE